MAYGIVRLFKGGTKDQYEATLAKVHPSDGTDLPEGQTIRFPWPDWRARQLIGNGPVDSSPEALEQDHEGGEGDAEADDRDVDGERERLHLPRLEQVVLVDRGEGSRGE
jgi:hypothetical protein